MQMHREQKPHQPQIVISVKMADKNMINFVDWNFVGSQLELAPFATVDEDMPILDE